MSQRDAIAARRELVASLVLARHSMGEMARLLQVGKATIHSDVVALRKEWLAKRTAATEEAASEDLQRLEAIERAIWPAAIKGDVQAIDRLFKCMERRAKMLGIDAPTKVDIQHKLEEMAEAAGLDPDEAVREAQGILANL